MKFILKTIFDKYIGFEKFDFIKNVFFSSLGQIINYLVPLLFTPIILERIGLNQYGYLALVLIVFNYMGLIIGFGFPISAVPKFLKFQNQKKELNLIFSDIIFSKIFNFFIAIIIGITIITLYQDLKTEIVAFAFCILINGFGLALFQDWFLIAKQKAEYHFFALLISRSFYVYFILFTNYCKTLVTFVVLEAFVNLLIGLITIILIKKNFKFELSNFDFRRVKIQWEEGFSAFLAYLAVFFYSSINVIILGKMLNAEQVGLYNLIDRVYIFIIGGFSIVLRSLYPLLSNSANNNNNKYFLTLVKKIAITLPVSMIVIVLILWLFENLIIDFISKKQLLSEQLLVLKKLFKFSTLTSILHMLAAFFSYIFFILKKEKLLLKIFLFATVFNLTTIYFSIHTFEIFGLSLSLFFVYVFIVFFQIKIIFFSKIKYCQTVKF